MRNSPAGKVALGGILAAVAVILFSLGGLIPVATFLTPVMGAILLQTVLRLCGKRIAWAWYGMVAILTLLMSPDKEAALLFLFLGYYPILKPALDRSRLRLAWKLLLFNAAIICMYGLLTFITGASEILDEYREMESIWLAVMVVMGNATFFLLDILLGRRFPWRR